MENLFTATIKSILKKHFGKNAELIFDKSLLIQYINEKTRSVNKGSKSRSSFANLYAIYVIIEDYISNDYIKNGDYSKYEGALFVNLFKHKENCHLGANFRIML